MAPCNRRFARNGTYALIDVKCGTQSHDNAAGRWPGMCVAAFSSETKQRAARRRERPTFCRPGRPQYPSPQRRIDFGHADGCVRCQIRRSRAGNHGDFVDALGSRRRRRFSLPPSLRFRTAPRLLPARRSALRSKDDARLEDEAHVVAARSDTRHLRDGCSAFQSDRQASKVDFPDPRCPPSADDAQTDTPATDCSERFLQDDVAYACDFGNGARSNRLHLTRWSNLAPTPP